MLIACLACGKRISDRAPACPFCGAMSASPPVSQLEAKGAPGVSSPAPEAAAEAPGPAPTAIAPTPRFQRGDFIGGQLQVLEVLGEGGFGVVYLAASQETGQLLAVKALRSELLRDAHVVEMFRKEARIWIDLGRHPFLVKAVWVEEIGGRLYLAMEYVRGRPGQPNSLVALRRYVECVSQVNKALELNPRFVQGWQRKAQALDAAGRHEESLAAWEIGLELASKNIHLLNGRGLALLALGRDADALSSFDQALGLDPRFSLARYNKARAEERLGRAADAARSYQQFLAVAPPHLVAQIEDARRKIQDLKPA